MGRDTRAAVDGAVGGLIATTAMSAFMLAAHRAGALGTPPPRRVTDAVLHATGLGRPPTRWRNALAVAGHLGFGTALGIPFALVQRRLPASPGPLARGPLFASGVWFVSYQGWAPALGIMPPAHRDRPGRPATMLAAHWLYGATLSWYVARRGA